MFMTYCLTAALKDFVERARNPKNVDVVHQFLQESESTYGIELIRIMTKDRSISEVDAVYTRIQFDKQKKLKN